MSGKEKEALVNGERVDLEYREGDSLLAALRRNGYYGVKHGCDEGVCGACNVLLGDDQLVKSCTMPADQYGGEEITTVAGLTDDDGSLHPLQEEFLDHGAAQCGFCIPGMILSGVKLLRENEDPSDEEIRAALSGNICRCTGYVQQIEAVSAAAESMHGDTTGDASGDLHSDD